ncbi:MAG: alpha/beta hydrolase, partial [Ruminococcus bromii]
MRKLAVYVHGKGGNATESEHYKPLLPEYDVIGFDYKSETPWDAKQKFTNLFDNYCKNYDYIVLIANSIGAFYSMNAFSDKQIDKAMFISPVVDMENLITNMMKWANVTENELRDKKTISTEFGETLSWEYLCYVRENQISWNVPTSILSGENDNLTSFEIINKFAEKINADLTV